MISMGGELMQTRGGGRIEWVDTAKAFGLFLVFWGHLLYGGANLGEVINRAIYSFHMPMYFILSGFVMKKDTTTFIKYISIKFRRVLLPAILLYFLTIPFLFAFRNDSTFTIKFIFSNAFYLFGQCSHNDPIWFFFCLFQILIVAKLIRLPDYNIGGLCCIMVLSLFLSWLCYSQGWEFCNFGGLNKFFLGLFFITFGLLLKRIRYDESVKTVGIVSLPVWLLFGVLLNTKVSIYSLVLGNFWFFIIAGITGSLFYYSICKLFEKCVFIRQYARWTIFIVCSHYVLVRVFNIIAFKLSFLNTWFDDVISFIFVILALLAYKPLCIYLEKNIPVLLGDSYVPKNH